MSFIDCVEDKLNKGLITDGQAETVQSTYESYYKQYQSTMSSDDAAAQAAYKTAKLLADRISKENINKLKSAKKQVELSKKFDADFEKQKQFYNSLNKAQQAVNLSPSYGRSVRDYLEKIYVRQQSIRTDMIRMIADFAEMNRSKWAGLVQDRSIMPDVVRQIIDGKSANQVARDFGGEVGAVFDRLHKMHTAAGGIIGKIENFFPARHNPNLIKDVSFDEWSSFITPLLNRDKMIDPETGLKYTDEKLQTEMLDDYMNMTTNGLYGLSKRVAEGKRTFGYGGEINKRRESSRFYHFKNADSFLEYNEKFGVGNDGLFDAVIHYIDSMSRDISVMEMLSPHSNGVMRHLELRQVANGDTKRGLAYTSGMYDVLTGKANADGVQELWYKTLEGTKDILRAAYLGKAVVSSITDTAFSHIVAKQNGLKTTNILKNWLSQINPLNSTDRAIAARSGYIADSLNGSSFSAARMDNDSSSPGMTRWLANFTVRAQGLAATTNAWRNAIALEAQGVLADLKVGKVKWNDVPTELKEAMMRNDINEQDYSNMMKAGLYTPPDRPDVTFLRPEEILAVNEQTAYKVMDWIQSMRQQALNEPTLRTKAITTGAFAGDPRPGTFNRAFWGSSTMFKSFVITNMVNFLIPAIAKASVGRTGELATIAIATTVLGAVAIQAKELLMGKTTKDMDSTRFWMAAAAQGGGMGLFGDFLFSDKSRFNRDFTTELLGPVFGLGNDVVRTFKGSFDKAINEKDTSFTKDITKLALRNTPAIHLWYGDLVVRRLLTDHLERMVDDNYDKRMRIMERKMEDESGQQFWWSPR